MPDVKKSTHKFKNSRTNQILIWYGEFNSYSFQAKNPTNTTQIFKRKKTFIEPTKPNLTLKYLLYQCHCIYLDTK